MEADVDLGTVVARALPDVAAGSELVEFAEGAHRLDDEAAMARARDRLVAAVGAAGAVDAALTVAIFRSLNIAADASGIPLDDEWHDIASGFVGRLGLEAFASARNTPGFGRTAPAGQ
ncbi:MAG: hypothetical protein ACE5GB_00155 [Acidimicrobiales bacterium]